MFNVHVYHNHGISSAHLPLRLWGDSGEKWATCWKKKVREGFKRGKTEEIDDGRGEEGKPPLVWLLFTRISEAYVTLHLPCTFQHTRSWHDVGVWAPDVFIAPFFSVSVCLCVCLSARLLAHRQLVFHALGIIWLTDTANNVLVNLPAMRWPPHAVGSCECHFELLCGQKNVDISEVKREFVLRGVTATSKLKCRSWERA